MVRATSTSLHVIQTSDCPSNDVSFTSFAFTSHLHHQDVRISARSCRDAIGKFMRSSSVNASLGSSLPSDALISACYHRRLCVRRGEKGGLSRPTCFRRADWVNVYRGFHIQTSDFVRAGAARGRATKLGGAFLPGGGSCVVRSLLMKGGHFGVNPAMRLALSQRSSTDVTEWGFRCDCPGDRHAGRPVGARGFQQPQCL